MDPLIQESRIKTIHEELKHNYSSVQLSDDFYAVPGQEHYALLAYLSTCFNNSHIIEIGTHRGESAVALSYNSTNTVYTFDIEAKVSDDKKLPNIQFVIDDIMTNKETRAKWKDIILSSAFIFMDVDPHNGAMEYEFYTFLKECDYKGFVVCDDIWYFKDMRNHFWYKVPDCYRYDISYVGHWSGTGIIDFGFDQTMVDSFGHIVKSTNPRFAKADNSDWTLVTAYFDLTKCPDASAEIIKRDANHYLDNAMTTLCLPYNLVIYCNKETYDIISPLRPDYLKSRTKYIIQEFDEFLITQSNNEKREGELNNTDKTFAEYRDIINANRAQYPYEFDKRNTASYYLFCMSRYIMLQQSIETNPFKSTHFGWINFCIERMGYKNVKYLDEALTVHRNKFSTCYIDFQPPTLVQQTGEYFKRGRCGMCSGFFTGRCDYMFTACQMIIQAFLRYVSLGYGHADEQLYSPVFFERPDIFEHYYGDYLQMITNYVVVRECPEAPIRNFITNSFQNGEYNLCIQACEFVIGSLKKGTCSLNKLYTDILYEKYIESKFRTGFYISHSGLDNFQKIHVFIQRILDNGQNEVCYKYCRDFVRACAKLNAGEHKVPSAYRFLILYCYFVSSFYARRDSASSILQTIRTECENDLQFCAEYQKKRDFYESQFRFIA